ncbi:MAG: hypothetical protein WC201_02540 [Bacilli bacterium]
MKTKFKKQILSLVLGIVVLPLTSCGISYFDGFFSENMKWESDDGKFTMFAQGAYFLENYGQMEINGSIENIVFRMFYNSMLIYLNNDEISRDECSIGINLKRISDGGFLSFTDESFTGTVARNTTGDSYWDDWKGTFTGSPLAESELNAKFYLGTTFENDDLDIIFGLKSYEESAFTYKLYGSYVDDQIEFSFGNNKDFIITDSNSHTASGTYTSRYDGMDLLFTTNDIFDIDGNTIALESTNTMDFVDA